jgi:integrase
VHKARLKADPAAKPMPHWTLHDLRRTGATMMNESPPLGLGMQPHIVEAILNHVSGTRAGVAGIYNRALYLAEKTAALEAWGRYVVRLAA